MSSDPSLSHAYIHTYTQTDRFRPLCIGQEDEQNHSSFLSGPHVFCLHHCSPQTSSLHQGTHDTHAPLSLVSPLPGTHYHYSSHPLPFSQVSPLKGVVDADGQVPILIEYTPQALGTIHCEIRLELAQYHYRPFVTTITASAQAGEVCMYVCSAVSRSISLLCL